MARARQKQVTIQLPDQACRAVDHIAERDNRSRSNTIATLVLEALHARDTMAGKESP